MHEKSSLWKIILVPNEHIHGIVKLIIHVGSLWKAVHEYVYWFASSSV